MPGGDEPVEPRVTREPPDRGGGGNRSNPISFQNARKFLIRGTGSSISTLNPFLVRKFLINCIGHPKDVKKLRSGDLLIVTADVGQSRILSSLTSFCNVPCTVEIPFHWNTCKGTVIHPDFADMSDEEISDGMVEMGVVGAKVFLRTNRVTGNRERSRTALLTFQGASLPEHVYVGFSRCTVTQYLPEPLRCWNCQEFGHRNDRCKNSQVCAKCNKSGHSDKQCAVSVDDYKCRSCSGVHPAFSRDCPKYVKEKLICEYKVVHDMTYPEARRAVDRKVTSTSYASAARGPAPVASAPAPAATASVSTQVSCNSVETQTLLSFPFSHDVFDYKVFDSKMFYEYDVLTDQRRPTPSDDSVVATVGPTEPLITRQAVHLRAGAIAQQMDFDVSQSLSQLPATPGAGLNHAAPPQGQQRSDRSRSGIRSGSRSSGTSVTDSDTPVVSTDSPAVASNAKRGSGKRRSRKRAKARKNN